MTRLALAALAAALLLAAPAQAGWTPTGALDAAATDHARSAVGTDLGGVPYVVWTEGSEAASQVRVARFADGAWQPVGGPLGSGLSIEPTVVASGGTVYAAWAERPRASAPFQIQVAKLVDGAWVPVASPSATDARDPSLADAGGVPHVAWTQPDAQNIEVVVARLEGAAWTPVGGLVNHSSRAAAADTSPLALIDPPDQWAGEEPELAVVAGVLHVAWTEQGEARVARLTGGAWREYGTGEPAVASGGVAQVDLAEVAGRPYVAWRQAEGRFAVRVAALGEGETWTSLGAVNPTGSADDPSLLSVGGKPWIAFERDDDVRVLRFDGTSWSEPSAGALDARNARTPSLFTVAGHPWAAWSDGWSSTAHDVRASRLAPDFLTTKVTAGATTATFVTQLRTFGLSYPFAFAYGPAGGELPLRTPATTATGDETSVAASVSGLSPRTAYEVQPTSIVAGPRTAFTTTKRNGR